MHFHAETKLNFLITVFDKILLEKNVADILSFKDTLVILLHFHFLKGIYIDF